MPACDGIVEFQRQILISVFQWPHRYNVGSNKSFRSFPEYRALLRLADQRQRAYTAGLKTGLAFHPAVKVFFQRQRQRHR